MDSIISTVLRIATVLEVLTVVFCQFPMNAMQPMPYQIQHQANLASPMVPVPPLPPNFMSPMSIPMRYPMSNRMPSVVMPYYKNKGKKHRRKKQHRRYESYDSSESNSREYTRKSKRRRQVLTPVVSYVTRDGYVVYQKKIKKDKAKDWLEMNKKRDTEEIDSKEQKFKRSMRRRKNSNK